MIESINSLLLPIENWIKINRKYIGYFFIILAFLSIGFLFFENSTKESGEKALLALWIILWMPIFARVFGLKIIQALMPLRKELGILMGTLAVVHGMGYLVQSPDIIVQGFFWYKNGFVSYLAFGFFALLITIPLLLTSNNWAIAKLGKNWKRLQRFAYLIIILVVLHVVMIKFSRELEIGPIILLVLYFIGKTLEWRGFTFAKKIAYKKGQKWLCVPCGYIYDPIIGDEDSGIAPGTEFSDIPNSWKCPVCGVSKADFVLYIEGETSTKTHEAKIVEKTFLNSTTIELIIETVDLLKSKKGQFASFIWNDNEGDFVRSYSIAKHDGKKISFLIKLTELGRGAHILKEIQVNANIRISGIFGHFVLQDTKNPKIFVATGTGLAPIYNMIEGIGEDIEKSLYFTVATGSELFYVDTLKSIPNLKLHIHTTKEEVPGCEFGRVDIDTIEATPDTEWYLCGNPHMVAEAREKLSKRGFEKVYSEEF